MAALFGVVDATDGPVPGRRGKGCPGLAPTPVFRVIRQLLSLSSRCQHVGRGPPPQNPWGAIGQQGGGLAQLLGVWASRRDGEWGMGSGGGRPGGSETLCSGQGEDKWPAGDQGIHCPPPGAAPSRPRQGATSSRGQAACPSVQDLAGGALRPSRVTDSYPRAKGCQTTVQQNGALQAPNTWCRQAHRWECVSL